MNTKELDNLIYSLNNNKRYSRTITGNYALKIGGQTKTNGLTLEEAVYVANSLTRVFSKIEIGYFQWKSFVHIKTIYSSIEQMKGLIEQLEAKKDNISNTILEEIKAKHK